MKTIAASVGLVALGVSTLHSEAQTSDPQASKPWSVSLSLRGFYDDNINGTKNNKVDAFGFEVSPSLGYSVERDQTSLNLGYTYSGKYYGDPPNGRSDHWDQSHIFEADLAHRINPRNRIAITDSFVIGQEPDVLRVLDMPTATYQRVKGDNIRNYGAIIYNTEVTEVIGFELGYDNAYWNYADDGESADGFGNIVASNSGLLDRIDNRVHLDSRWQFRPETVGIVGYQFTQTSYTGDEGIAGPVGTPTVVSDDRDNRTHAFYGGVEHTFNPTLAASLKAGAQYADYYGDSSNDDSELYPFVLANVTYAYAQESSAQLGIQHQLGAANLVGASGDFVRDMSATTVYGSVIHRIMPNLFGTLLASYQLSTYNGGGSGVDGESDDFFQVGIDFSYRFNPHLSAHAGYNFDTLSSQVQQDFDRNRVYLGLTAQY
jgi:hypothetical protein